MKFTIICLYVIDGGLSHEEWSGMSSKFLLVKSVWTQSASSKYKVVMRRKGGGGDEGRKGRRGKENGGEGSCHKPPT